MWQFNVLQNNDRRIETTNSHTTHNSILQILTTRRHTQKKCHSNMTFRLTTEHFACFVQLIAQDFLVLQFFPFQRNANETVQWQNSKSSDIKVHTQKIGKKQNNTQKNTLNVTRASHNILLQRAYMHASLDRFRKKCSKVRESDLSQKPKTNIEEEEARRKKSHRIERTNRCKRVSARTHTRRK